jgi:hypothetical protein
MTAQETEILIFDDEQFDMTSNPSLNGKAEAGFSGRTSNYRGYVGVWEVKDNKLYLNEVRGGFMMEKGPFLADWVSQELHVWKGLLLHYVHAGYGSMYEEDMFFDIEYGILKGTRTESNVEKFKELVVQEVREASNKTRMQYLYSLYLDPHGELSRLIARSIERKQEYANLQQDLEFDFKQRLMALAEDPASGISLVYK